MKILVLEGSPHRKSSSNMLAENFAKGAAENGHEVTTYDVAHAKIAPCIGCNACGMNGKCAQKDDMEEIINLILETDMLVFVSPVYYFAISAQLKAMLDRFYSFNTTIKTKGYKAVLIVAAWDTGDFVMDAVVNHYKTICSYLNFEDCGMILGGGCGTPSMTMGSRYMRSAYELGKSIK